MEKKNTISSRTRKNWYVDVVLFLGAVIASLSGIYFLIFPDGGYMGGRNPYYGIQIIFKRAGWEWIHTWLSLVFIGVAILHVILHLNWLMSTTKRMFRKLLGKHQGTMSADGRHIVIVDSISAISFLVSAVSGVYFIFVGESHGGLNPDPMFLFSRTVWELIHLWTSIVFISSFMLHFVAHWGWVTKITRKMFGNVSGRKTEQTADPAVQVNQA